MPDGPSKSSSQLLHATTSGIEEKKTLGINSASSCAVANAIKRNKKLNNRKAFINKINGETEEHKKKMWEKFIENEKKNRIFDSLNPRDTLPSPYLKTLEEAYLVRQKFKYCVVASGAVIKYRRVLIYEVSLPSLKIKPQLRTTHLTSFSQDKKPYCCVDQGNSPGLSFLTLSSCRTAHEDEQDVRQQDEIRQQKENRELPESSRFSSSEPLSEADKDTSEEHIPTEVKFNLFEKKQDESEVSERKSQISFKEATQLEQGPYATVSVRSITPDGPSTSKNVVHEPPSENSKPAKSSMKSKISLEGNSVLSLEHSKSRHGSQHETLSGTESTITTVTIPDKRRSSSFLKRFIQRFSDTDKESPISKRLFKDTMKEEIKRSSENPEEEENALVEEKKTDDRGIFKKAWDRTKKFTMLGLAANDSSEKVNPPNSESLPEDPKGA